MPLSDYVAACSKALCEFLDDDGSNLLCVAVAPETELFAAKLIASTQAEARSDELFFSHSGTFSEPAPYYAAAARAVLANLQTHADALAREGVALAGLDGLCEASILATDLPVEIAFAAFAERAARELSSLCTRIVLVLHADHASDSERFSASVQRLASLSAVACVKYVAFVGCDANVGADAPAAQRFNVVDAVAPGCESGRVLPTFLHEAQRRVLLVQRALRAAPWLSQLGEPGDRALQPLQIALRQTQPGSILNEAVAGVVAAARDCSKPIRIRADLAAPAQFADACEQLQQHCLPPDGVLCVVLVRDIATTQLANDELAQLALQLTHVAASPRVKYLLIDDGFTPHLPALTEAPRRISRQDIRINANLLEAGLQKRLAEPTLPVHERVQFLGACATLATRRGEYERALQLHETQLALSEQSDDPGLAILTWLGIGDTMQSAQQWEDAQDAFATALDSALDHQRDALGAQAVLRLGHAQLRAAQLAEAIASYQLARNWFTLLGQEAGLAYCLTWLGEAQRRHGDHEAARDTWLAARARCTDNATALGDQAEQYTAELTERLNRLAAEHSAERAATPERNPSAGSGSRDVFVAEQP